MTTSLFLLVVFLVVSLALAKEGLWGSLLMLLNVLVAATVATAWHETVAAALENRLPGYAFLLDFVAAWGLFCLIVLGLREATDRASRTRVKLRRPVELFGGPLVAALVGWVMTCFTATTLHLAPLPRDVVQPTPEARMFFGLAPDRKWLQWVRTATLRGPFAVPGRAFDADADFIIRSADRRKRLEGEAGLRVNR